MRIQRTSLLHAVVGIVAATMLVLPTLSVARADQPEQTQVAKKHSKKHVAPQPNESQSWLDTRCKWPYQNQFPPCMSTWPAGDPNYHGSRPGPTFDTPW